MIETLSMVEGKAAKHTYLVCWSGIIFDLQNRLVRADKMFLNVIHNDPVEGITYRRLAPVINRRTPDGDREHWLGYRLASCYRVLSGERTGKVVTEADLRDDEKYRRTGLDKRLEIGKDPWKFSNRRKGDRAVVDLLQGVQNCMEASLQDVLPNMFLTVKKRCPRVRDTQDAPEYLRGFA